MTNAVSHRRVNVGQEDMERQVGAPLETRMRTLQNGSKEGRVWAATLRMMMRREGNALRSAGVECCQLSKNTRPILACKDSNERVSAKS